MLQPVGCRVEKEGSWHKTVASIGKTFSFVGATQLCKTCSQDLSSHYLDLSLVAKARDIRPYHKSDTHTKCACAGMWAETSPNWRSFLITSAFLCSCGPPCCCWAQPYHPLWNRPSPFIVAATTMPSVRLDRCDWSLRLVFEGTCRPMRAVGAMWPRSMRRRRSTDHTCRLVSQVDPTAPVLTYDLFTAGGGRLF